MTGFVKSDGALFLLGHHLGLLLQTAYDAIYSGDEVLLRDSLLAVARCNQCGLVADVGDVRTAEARRLARQQVYVEGFIHLDGFQMHLEHRLALVQVGQIDMDLTVEASGTQQRLVQDVSTVRGGHDDDTAVGAKAVHLRQQLVQGALALVVAAHHGVVGTCTTHSVDLIDEDDARRFLLGLAEQVTHTAGTHAHEHLHEVGTRHREERHVGLTRYGFRQQRLTRSRRAYKQRTLGDLTTQVGELLRVFQELHNLLHLLLG